MLLRRFAVIAAVSCALLGWTSAGAAAGLDLCNDLLQQDLFNRTSGSSQASESERQAYLDTFFQSDEDKAYEEYKKARAEQHSSSTAVHAEGHYGIIGGEFDLSTEHGGAMSKEDFSKQFSERKAVRQSQSSGSSARASSLISTYQSAIRDPNTIEAWRQCMLSRTSDPSIVAYGYRNVSGNPYLTVMWLPGRALASISPQVDIRFVSPDPDISVEGAAQPVTLASGSGQAFALRFKTSDSAAKFRGFAVLVNAAARDGPRHLMDFQEQAVVPAAVGEVPCELLIQAGREYGFLLYSPSYATAEFMTSAKGVMYLQVNDLIPGGATGVREFNAEAGFSSEAAQKLIAMSQNKAKTILRVMHPTKAWIQTQGSSIKFRMGDKTHPDGLGDTALGRCTLNEAVGSVPSQQMTMKFRISANR